MRSSSGESPESVSSNRHPEFSINPDLVHRGIGIRVGSSIEYESVNRTILAT